jgi:hypothetical protein
MSSLFEGILKDLGPLKRKRCKVGRLLESLSPADAEILEAAVQSDGIGMRKLAHELTKRGLMISETPLYAHRSRSCGCYQEARS